MNPKNLESEEASSSEESKDEEEDEGEEKSVSESSTDDDDEFDSADDRVNVVPGAAPEEGSKESESEDEGEEEDDREVPAMKPTEFEKIKRFDSDVESEYETDSSSESKGLTQKPVEKESSVEALPLTQTKAKKNDVSVNDKGAESAHAVKKGKDKARKQQQPDPKLVKINEEDHPPAKKGRAGAAKHISVEQSAKDEKKGVHLATKRKLEQSGHDVETDSTDSVPISKRRKDVNAAQNGKVGVDKNRAALTLSDNGKEIARKTLSDPSVRQKNANAESNKGPQSPQKTKKLPHIWSTDEEIIMASEVLNRVKMGLEIPSKRNDDFWLTLSEILNEKVGVEFSRDQLSEKVRRLKPRYEGMVQKIKESQELQKPFKFKTDSEQSLFDIWSQIWGRAEVTSLDDHEEPSKPVVATIVARDGKNPPKVSKSKPPSNTNLSKEDGVTTADDSTGRDALQVDTNVTMPMELDKGEAAKEEHTQDGPKESDALSKDVHKLLEDKISTSLHELQLWSKNSIEAWMNKALALIDTAVRSVGDQARRMNATGIAGGGLPMRLCDCMESQLVHGEQSFQQQWYELHLQELNVYAQRLDLLRRECELKQEHIKLLLQKERGT